MKRLNEYFTNLIKENSMKIKDVKVNEFYLVQYDYKMKPCDCPCHTNDKILDMAPCCQDDS